MPRKQSCASTCTCGSEFSVCTCALSSSESSTTLRVLTRHASLCFCYIRSRSNCKNQTIVIIIKCQCLASTRQQSESAARTWRGGQHAPCSLSRSCWPCTSCPVRVSLRHACHRNWSCPIGGLGSRTRHARVGRGAVAADEDGPGSEWRLGRAALLSFKGGLKKQ